MRYARYMELSVDFQVGEHGTKNKKVLFILGGWKTKQLLYFIPAQILAWKGYRCIVYTYEPSVLSPDVPRTREALHVIQDDIIQRIKVLKEEGIDDFSIYGFSLGSVISCMVADKEPAISRVILNTTGVSLAAAVWSWDDKMPGFKQSLIEQGYTLKKLEQEWYDLAPTNNVENFRDKQVLMYLAINDQVIPYTLGKQLAAQLRTQEVLLELITNKHGSHATAGMLNVYRVKRYLRFLQMP